MTRAGRDFELKQRLIAGDESALAETYDLFAAQVFGLAARVTADKMAAEDVTQEVFLYIWEHPETFDPTRAPLRSWLCTLAHRRAVDWVRRTESRRRATEVLAREPMQFLEVEDGVLNDASSRAVRDAVNVLPVEQRTVIALAYFEGMTHRQVAATLAIPEGTAKSRIRIGLKRIADHLRRNGHLDEYA